MGEARCGRCWGAGKNMIPSTSNALPNLQCVFVEVECSVCGGTGKRQTTPDPAEAERAAEARIVAWLRKGSACHRAYAEMAPDPTKVEQLTAAWLLEHYAAAIEAGEHRKEPRDGR